MEINQNKVQLNTTVPNIDIVEPAKSAAPANFSALSGLAGGLYKLKVTNDAHQESEQVVRELDADLSSIDAGEDIAKRLSSEMSELASVNPDLAQLKTELDKMKTGGQQRQMAKLLYTIKAEAALKRTLAKAPGLRPEIVNTMSQTLGFDPSAATVKAILRGIDIEGDEISRLKGAQPEQYEYKQSVEILQGKGLTWVAPENTGGDFGEATRLNKEAYRRFSNLDSNLTAIKTKLSNGDLKEGEAISGLIQTSGGLFNEYVGPINSAILAALPRVTNDQEFETLRNQVIPQVDTLMAQLDVTQNYISRDLTLSPEGRKTYNDFLQQQKAAIKEGLTVLLESGNSTRFQQNATILKALGDNYGLSFAQQHKALYTLNNLSPTLVPAFYNAIMLSSPKDLNSLKGMVTDMFNDVVANKMGPKDIGNLFQLMQEPSKYDNMSKQEKANALANTLKLLGNATNVSVENMSIQEVRHIGSLYGTVMQLGNEMPSSYWTKAAEISTSPIMEKSIAKLAAGDKDDKLMAGTLARTANSSASRYIQKDLLGRMAANGFISPDKFTYDMSTGKLSFTGKVPEFKASPSGLLGLSPFAVGNAPEVSLANAQSPLALKTVNDFETMINTIETYKAYDPSIADLSREQIAYIVAAEAFGKAGIKMTGTPPAFKQESQAEASKINLNDLLTNIGREFESTKFKLKDIEKNEKLVNSKRELKSLKEQREALRKQQEELEDLITQAKTGGAASLLK